MKKILLIFGATSSLFTQEYDPYTGKPIRLPTKNILTGQIQENETIPTVKLVKVELKSEETVSGELIQEKNTFIIIKNEVLGILQIEKNKIAEIAPIKTKKILKNNINSIQCLKYLNF